VIPDFKHHRLSSDDLKRNSHYPRDLPPETGPEALYLPLIMKWADSLAERVGFSESAR
jgi:hypothetical protein